jgi:lipoprotein-anchoring transpeptidase ErfK/SrfK
MLLAALLLTSIACSSTGSIAQSLLQTTSSPAVSESWSSVDLPKPTATPTPLAPEPTPTITAATTEAAVPPSTEQQPLITMEIVDEGSQALDPAQAPSPQYTGGKYILVSISEQHLYAYENGQLVFSFTASTGMGNSTRAGSFQVLDKIPNAYGANWDIWMPDWLGIYWSGSLENGIHALPILPSGARLWAGYLGVPISYGCVVLGVDEALQLYDWADIGTPVEIRW